MLGRLEDDFAIESIAKYTGLTEEEIKALMHELTKLNLIIVPSCPGG
jgi:hypothetical protein